MAIEIGWIKLHRKIVSSRMFQSLTSAQRDVMLCCLLMANHEENEWEWGAKVFRCVPGQFITSLPGIKKMCAKDVSIQEIRTALLKLEKWGFLTGISTETGRLITINKWNTYQDNQQTEQQTPQQTPNRQPTAIEEEEEVKKLKKGERASVLNPGFSDDFMITVWPFFIANKKGAYRTVAAQGVALRQLFEIAENEDEAKRALRETISNNYQGFTWFFDRKKERGTNGTGNRKQGVTPEQFEELINWTQDGKAISA